MRTNSVDKAPGRRPRLAPGNWTLFHRAWRSPTWPWPLSRRARAAGRSSPGP